MPCRSSEELDGLVREAKKVTKHGKVADYIPALQKGNRDDLSVAIYHADGTCLSAGDIEQKITLQSISKVLSLALALMDCGEECVFNKVGYEPTGDPFNSIIKLETNHSRKPLNPMINAGALAVTHLIKGVNVEERLERLISFIRDLAGHNVITYSLEVAQSEFETAFLNRSLFTI